MMYLIQSAAKCCPLTLVDALGLSLPCLLAGSCHVQAVQTKNDDARRHDWLPGFPFWNCRVQLGSLATRGLPCLAALPLPRASQCLHSRNIVAEEEAEGGQGRVESASTSCQTSSVISRTVSVASIDRSLPLVTAIVAIRDSQKHGRSIRLPHGASSFASQQAVFLANGLTRPVRVLDGAPVCSRMPHGCRIHVK